MAIPACVSDLAIEFSANRHEKRLAARAQRLPSEGHQLLLVAMLWQRGFHVAGDQLMRKLRLPPSAFAFVPQSIGAEIACVLRWAERTAAPARSPVGPGAGGSVAGHAGNPAQGVPS